MIMLHKLAPGKTGVVVHNTLTGAMGRRVEDLGLMEDTKVTCVHRSPSGDPGAYLIRGAVIALRGEDAKHILVKLEG